MLCILNKALGPGEKLNPENIERCHPIGKLNSKNNRQVIVKLMAYKTKARVYDSQFNLHNVSL